jgi:hypothetical protein
MLESYGNAYPKMVYSTKHFKYGMDMKDKKN